MGKSDEEEDDHNEIEADGGQKQGDDSENIEEKHGSDAKYHFLIEPDSNLQKPLPSYIQLVNPIPNEPMYMKKRNSPKALRFFKPKLETNPARNYLQELLLYHTFGKKQYEIWTGSEITCIEDYLKERENIKKVKQQVMEWLEDVEEARNYVEETLRTKADNDEAGIDMDAEKEQEMEDC